jgi:hypothetical protein
MRGLEGHVLDPNLLTRGRRIDRVAPRLAGHVEGNLAIGRTDCRPFRHPTVATLAEGGCTPDEAVEVAAMRLIGIHAHGTLTKSLCTEVATVGAQIDDVRMGIVNLEELIDEDAKKRDVVDV